MTKTQVPRNSQHPNPKSKSLPNRSQLVLGFWSLVILGHCLGNSLGMTFV